MTDNYDLPALLSEHLASAREAVVAAQSDGDPYGLVEFYEQEVTLLEDLRSEPVPDRPQEQIDVLRRVYTNSGQGIGNVLDVTGVSDDRDVFTAQRLNDQETIRLVGHNHPSVALARQAVSKINEELGRGECVCFAVYEDGAPVGWYFVGNTVD